MASGWDKKYCYPDSNVLINKLGIENLLTLVLAEREFTSLRVYELEENPVKGNLDLNHLQEIHKYIFQDLYEWAGQIRTVNIAKGNVFCECRQITQQSEQLLKNLQGERYLIGVQKNKIAERFGYYFGEINKIHPFREGNGRSQREFIKSLGLVSGYDMDFSKVNSSEMIDFCDKAFHGDFSHLVSMFNQIISPITAKEQGHFIDLISKDNSPIKKIYRQYMMRLENEL